MILTILPSFAFENLDSLDARVKAKISELEALSKQALDNVSFEPDSEPKTPALRDYNDVSNHELYIFISFSMPDRLLQDLNGHKLVLRGMYEGSMSKTVQKIQALGLQNVIIHPQLFKQFAIVAVPTIVLSNGTVFDKVVGSLSLHSALELFRNKGQTSDRIMRQEG